MKQVKISLCAKGHFVRIADKEFLDKNTKIRNEFKKEVLTYNLKVITITKDLYENSYFKYCNCK